jgi:ADP-ribose pyrophosphatase YjhB (NUDIX family)
MSFRPDLTVAAVVEHEGRYLLVEERVGNRVVFNQPAGHVERGESFVDAVVRETLEETARGFVPDAVLGIYTWEQPERQRSFLRVAFTGHVGDQDLARPLDRGILRSVWMSREQVITRAARMRSPMVLRCIDDHLAGKRFPLEVLTSLLPGQDVTLRTRADARVRDIATDVTAPR